MIIGRNQYALNINQVLLKGSNLKNTEWVLGVVVYTGKDTKLMMNSQKSRTKQSNVEKRLNWIIFRILCIQLTLCLSLSIIMSIYDASIDDDQDQYLGDGESDENPFLNFFSYFLLLNTMIPISLVVTIEILKVIQCIFIAWDAEMYSIDDAAGCHVSTTTINEELGQVTYVFSDKTGTLTQNMMEFKAFCVEREIYGSIGDQMKRRPSRVEMASEIGYDFQSRKLDNVLDQDTDPKGDKLVIHSQNGKESYTLENDCEKVSFVLHLSFCLFNHYLNIGNRSNQITSFMT